MSIRQLKQGVSRGTLAVIFRQYPPQDLVGASFESRSAARHPSTCRHRSDPIMMESEFWFPRLGVVSNWVPVHVGPRVSCFGLSLRVYRPQPPPGPVASRPKSCGLFRRIQTVDCYDEPSPEMRSWIRDQVSFPTIPSTSRPCSNCQAATASANASSVGAVSPIPTT